MSRSRKSAEGQAKPNSAEQLAERFCTLTQEEQTKVIELLTSDTVQDNQIRRMLVVVTQWCNQDAKIVKKLANDSQQMEAYADWLEKLGVRLCETLDKVGKHIPRNPRRNSKRDALIVREFESGQKSFGQIGREQNITAKAAERAYHREKARRQNDSNNPEARGAPPRN